jgi:tetratricopeptide (TPR) repeat protein
LPETGPGELVLPPITLLPAVIGYNRAMQLQQAYTLFQQGRLDEAAGLCDELSRSHPGNPRILTLQSAILLRQGNRAGAARLLVEAAGLQAGDEDAQLKLANALRSMGALAEAERLLLALDARGYPGDHRVAVARAQLAWQSGAYSRALDGFEAAALRWASEAEPQLAFVRACLRSGQLDRAAEVLATSQRQWPSNPEVFRLWAVLELDRGQALTALQHLRAAGVQANTGNLPGRMRAALEELLGDPAAQPIPGAENKDDYLATSFAWARRQGERVRWFGSNTALLTWALSQVPDGLPATAPVVECGVYHGFSLNLLAARTTRPLHGFDSFQGLPEDWKPGEPAGSYSTGGRLPAVPAHVQLHPGWFEDSLPVFAATLESAIALLHVDCDLHSSTRTVLASLAPRLTAGSLLVFDDFLSFEGYEQHEFRAAHEYFAATPQQFELVGAVLLGRAVAYRLVRP